MARGPAPARPGTPGARPPPDPPSDSRIIISGPYVGVLASPRRRFWPRLLRAVRAGITAWREPELGLRDARIHLTPDGKLFGISFPGDIGLADREKIAREIADACRAERMARFVA